MEQYPVTLKVEQEGSFSFKKHCCRNFLELLLNKTSNSTHDITHLCLQCTQNCQLYFGLHASLLSNLYHAHPIFPKDWNIYFTRFIWFWYVVHIVFVLQKMGIDLLSIFTFTLMNKSHARPSILVFFWIHIITVFYLLNMPLIFVYLTLDITIILQFVAFFFVLNNRSWAHMQVIWRSVYFCMPKLPCFSPSTHWHMELLHILFVYKCLRLCNKVSQRNV